MKRKDINLTLYDCMEYQPLRKVFQFEIFTKRLKRPALK